MAGHDRITTKSPVHDAGDDEPGASWYLIVSASAKATHVVQLDEDCEVVIGRGERCAIAIDHDAVSRRHAVVRRAGDQVTVADLGSSNGTTVNGARVSRPRRLTAGDVIAIGPATVVVAMASAERRDRRVATVDELDERLAAEVDRAVRYHRPLALMMLRLDGPIDAVGAHVDQLAAQLRRMDLVAEYGADELALVLPETDRAAAGQVARRAAEAVGVRVHCGYATFPEDGSHAGELLGTARERLRGARRAATHRDRNSASMLRALGDRVVVADPQMKQVFELAKRVAGSNITVLVKGETGAGKEVVAEAVHRLGPRAAGPYVRLNCASLSESLVEAELFGHEKGAFTGADTAKPGFFEVASGGTLFLDEIGELPASTQAKLLRVLEHRRIVRVGGTSEIPVDVRLVCATNRNLETAARRGQFREDLFFRISAFVIPVPPLRDRRAEIPLLAAQFARELSSELGDTIATLSPDALAVLAAYDWPGNVRELRNVVERALVLCTRGRIEPHDLPEKLRERAGIGGRTSSLDARQREHERQVLVATLEACRGNQSQAARQLGVSRFALIRMMDKHGLKRAGR